MWLLLLATQPPSGLIHHFIFPLLSSVHLATTTAPNRTQGSNMATTMGAMLPAYSHPSRPPHGNHNHSSDDISMESQPRSTTKELNTSSALPKPLHIAKYDFKERQEQNGDDSSTPRAQARRSVNSRTVSPLSSRSSARSVLTNVSMESLPEPMGGQRPLTVPKRRDNNSSRTSQARGDAACGVGLSNCAEDRHEKGVADIMTSLGRMTLSGQSTPFLTWLLSSSQILTI